MSWMTAGRSHCASAAATSSAYQKLCGMGCACWTRVKQAAHRVAALLRRRVAPQSRHERGCAGLSTGGTGSASRTTPSSGYSSMHGARMPGCCLRVGQGRTYGHSDAVAPGQMLADRQEALLQARSLLARTPFASAPTNANALTRSGAVGAIGASG